MSEITAIVQCRNTGALPRVEGARLDTDAALSVMTNGFRIVFGRVFGEAWDMSGHAASIRWLGEDVTIERAVLLHSGSALLEGLEGDNWVLVLSLRVTREGHIVRESMNNTRASLGLRPDKEAYAELMAQLGDCPIRRVFGGLTFQVPDIKFTPAEPSERAVAVMPLLAGFYYFGLLTVHRIDRDQARADMPVASGFVDDGNADFIAGMRVRLLNVNRYFLTTNRSQYSEVKELCAQLAGDMNLATRYERQLTIHHDMERHLDNIAQIAQVRSSRQTQQASERTNSVLYYLTLVGLPLGVFSAVMTFSLDAPLVTQADRWPTWATFLVALGASATVALILLGLMLLVAAGRAKRCAADGRGQR